MAVNSNFSSQSSTYPVAGGFAQPSPGVTEAIVTPADPSGNAYATSLAASGTANLQTAQYRDSIITVQAATIATTPTSGATIASITPGTAGLWEVYGTVGMSGTTAVLVDSSNMALNQNQTARLPRIPYPVTGTAGTGAAAIPAVILNLAAVDVVSVTAVANATTGAVYSAALIARRVG